MTNTSPLTAYQEAFYHHFPLDPCRHYIENYLEQIRVLLEQCLQKHPRYIIVGFRLAPWFQSPGELSEEILPLFCHQLRPAISVEGAPLIYYAWSREQRQGERDEYRVFLLIPRDRHLDSMAFGYLLSNLHRHITTAWGLTFSVPGEFASRSFDKLVDHEGQITFGTELMTPTRSWVFRWMSDLLAASATKPLDGAMNFEVNVAIPLEYEGFERSFALPWQL